MRNCLILGSGRSGTSMVTGTLSHAGYYMGERLYPPRRSNPKGFFESPDINGINERLLAPHAPTRCRYPLLRLWRSSFPSERWLARIPPGTEVESSPRLARRIAVQVGRRPFAFKDPRFCYTLPAWRPHLPEGTVFLCVFREPGRTAASIVRECRRQYPDLHLGLDEAFGVWSDMYEHVLVRHRHAGQWLFVHYEQVIDGSAIPAIEKHVGARVDRDFPDVRLKRTAPGRAPARASAIYRELCALAGYPG